MNMRNVVIAIVWAAAGALSMQCAGASEADAAAIKVHYSDLDLSTEKGIRALYGRLRTAAYEVCGSVEPRDLAGAAAARVCKQNALAKAVEQIRAPGLTALYQHKLAREFAG